MVAVPFKCQCNGGFDSVSILVFVAYRTFSRPQLSFPTVFVQVKMGLGGNVQLVVSGAAPLATNVEEFLRVVTCAPVVQGYGRLSVMTFVQWFKNLFALGI